MTTGFIVICMLLPVLMYLQPIDTMLPRQDHPVAVWKGLPGSLLSLHNDWLWLVILSLCCTVWAQTLSLNALKKLNSFTITLSVNMEPVYGIILAILVFHENRELSSGFYAGMGLICLSVLLQMGRLLWQGRKNRLGAGSLGTVGTPPDESQYADKGQG
jgi:drug/metabolite transporter (DMT)-like permease